eukprot:scaffold118773_cov33-Phaeocystis_antarctica.AAC.1
MSLPQQLDCGRGAAVERALERGVHVEELSDEHGVPLAICHGRGDRGGERGGAMHLVIGLGLGIGIGLGLGLEAALCTSALNVHSNCVDSSLSGVGCCSRFTTSLDCAKRRCAGAAALAGSCESARSTCGTSCVRRVRTLWSTVAPMLFIMTAAGCGAWCPRANTTARDTQGGITGNRPVKKSQ